MAKKCKACEYVNSVQQDTFLYKLKKDTKYPIQDICISAYFEIDDDDLCFCFHNARAGVIANLIYHSSNDMPSIDEVTPAVTYLTKTGNADVFLLRGYDSNHNKNIKLYRKLKEVESIAYAMVESGTLKQVNSEVVKNFRLKTNSEEELLEKLRQGKEEDHPNFYSDKNDKDVITIRGQSLKQDIGYMAVSELGKHNGIPYLKKFTFKKLSEVMGQDPNEMESEEKKYIGQEYLNDLNENAHYIVGDKFDDIKEEDLDNETEDFPNLKLPEDY